MDIKIYYLSYIIIFYIYYIYILFVLYIYLLSIIFIYYISSSIISLLYHTKIKSFISSVIDAKNITMKQYNF